LDTVLVCGEAGSSFVVSGVVLFSGSGVVQTVCALSTTHLFSPLWTSLGKIVIDEDQNAKQKCHCQQQRHEQKNVQIN
jgi:hypothetical protein